MKTILRALTLITLIFLSYFLFTCNTENPTTPDKPVKLTIGKDDPPPCCNQFNPNIYGCYGPIYSLTCQTGSAEITCDCCKQYWNIYTQEQMNSGNVPCPGQGFVCPSEPNKGEQ